MGWFIHSSFTFASPAQLPNCPLGNNSKLFSAWTGFGNYQPNRCNECFVWWNQLDLSTDPYSSGSLTWVPWWIDTHQNAERNSTTRPFKLTKQTLYQFQPNQNQHDNNECSYNFMRRHDKLQWRAGMTNTLTSSSPGSGCWPSPSQWMAVTSYYWWLHQLLTVSVDKYTVIFCSELRENLNMSLTQTQWWLHGSSTLDLSTWKHINISKINTTT